LLHVHVHDLQPRAAATITCYHLLSCSMFIDSTELHCRLLKIHIDELLPPPSLNPKRGRRESTVPLPQPAPQHEGLVKNRVFDDVRLLVEHLLLQPRDQHRSSFPFANAHHLLQLICMTLVGSYWISLAGAGQLPLWLLEARSKIKSAMITAPYGEVHCFPAPKLPQLTATCRLPSQLCRSKARPFAPSTSFETC
jgi:hypothetical protein